MFCLIFIPLRKEISPTQEAVKWAFDMQLEKMARGPGWCVVLDISTIDYFRLCWCDSKRMRKAKHREWMYWCRQHRTSMLRYYQEVEGK